MRQPIEVAIELTAQELLSPPSAAGFVEIDDITTIILPQTAAVVANTGETSLAPDADSIEIELTAAEMDELLSGAP